MDFSSALQSSVESVTAKLLPLKRNNQPCSHVFFQEAIATAVVLLNFGPQVFTFRNPINIGRTLSNSYVLIDEVCLITLNPFEIIENIPGA